MSCFASTRNNAFWAFLLRLTRMSTNFGYRLPLENVYSFSDTAPAGSIVLIDELAAIADRYTGGSNRGRTLHNSLTSFRKGGNLALAATAAESHLSWQPKIKAMTVYNRPQP